MTATRGLASCAPAHDPPQRGYQCSTIPFGGLPIRQLVILGASGFARQTAWIARRTGAFSVVALVDELIAEPGAWDGIPIVPSLAAATVDQDDPELISAVGDPGLRRRWAEEHGSRFRFAHLIDPAALCAPNLIIEAGSMVLAGAICSTDVTIGAHTAIGFNVSLSHDVKVGSFTHVAGGVLVNGRARIGDGCRIGAGAILLPDVEIGDGATVGAGALVTKPVAPGNTVAGVPARILKPARS